MGVSPCSSPKSPLSVPVRNNKTSCSLRLPTPSHSESNAFGASVVYLDAFSWHSGLRSSVLHSAVGGREGCFRYAHPFELFLHRILSQQMASGVISLAGVVLFIGSRCPSPARMYVIDFGYILLGFGNATSYSFGFSLLRGDSRDVLHRKRDQLLSYQVFVTYMRVSSLVRISHESDEGMTMLMRIMKKACMRGMLSYGAAQFAKRYHTTMQRLR